MNYYLRNEKGQCTAVVDNVMAGKMMRELEGEWQQKNFSVEGKKTVFVFTEQALYGNDLIKLNILPGFYLVSY